MEREGERERESIYVCTYIYIYTHTGSAGINVTKHEWHMNVDYPNDMHADKTCRLLEMCGKRIFAPCLVSSFRSKTESGSAVV